MFLYQYSNQNGDDKRGVYSSFIVLSVYLYQKELKMLPANPQRGPSHYPLRASSPVRGVTD